MNYEDILSLLTKMKECEPKPRNYLFEHTYSAAQDEYENCISVINEVLCHYCKDSMHCEWFCNGECFEPKTNEHI